MHGSNAFMHDAEWDIFRYVLAVADHGSAQQAAQVLSVDPSTVQRRITRFEQMLSVQLFERTRSGYKPTESCRDILAAARAMASEAAAATRAVMGHDMRLEGSVALTTTDTVAQSVLAPHMREFQSLHPAIEIDLTVTSSRLSLERMDAHIAIRPSLVAPEGLIARKISSLAFAVYGHRRPDHDLLDRWSEALEGQSWIAPGEALSGSPVRRWLQDQVAPRNIRLHADSFVSKVTCAEAGVGLAVLPCCLGDQATGLHRWTLPLRRVFTSIWLLTHPDFSTSARVSALSDFLHDALLDDTPCLEGRLAG